MNSRARVKALPAIMAFGLGMSNLGSINRLLAQESTGAATPAGMPTGLEEISLEITEDGVTGMPESLEAGRYLVNVTGPASGEMGPSGVIFVQFPEGVTSESAYEDTMAAQDGMPSWFMDTHWGGGVTLAQGTESWGVIDFTPGAWATSTLFGTTMPVDFEVTGEMPADLPAVESNVTLGLGEMVIEIDEGEFVAGDNIITIINHGVQIHFVEFASVPDGTTLEMVEATMDSFMTGAPPAGDALNEEDLIPIAYMPDISGSVQQTLPLHLEAGTYFLTCWVPDMETGMPHAMMGMWTLVTIE